MAQAVELHVYDLSRGMAGPLSQPILGRRIDGIWHTGVHVFGKEFFFGGGIQELHPAEVVVRYQLDRNDVYSMGETIKSEQEFRQYLQQIQPRYTAATYNLLTHNCNNFADEVVGWLTDNRARIPEYIRELPNIVMSSPMARALLLPTLENMYGQMRTTQQPQQQGNSRSLIPQQNARPPTISDLETEYGKDLVEFFSHKHKETTTKSLLSVRKDFLFLANRLDPADCEKYGITHVLQLTSEVDTSKVGREVDFFELLPEGVDVEDFVEVATGFIQSVAQENGRCMVLASDVNVGGTVVIAYQLQANAPVSNALEKYMMELRRKRRGFYPSLDMMQCLVELEANTSGSRSQLNTKALRDLHLESESSKLAQIMLTTA